MGNQRARRRELTLRYSGTDDDTDAVYPAPDWKPAPSAIEPDKIAAAPPPCDGWPFDPAEARRRQHSVDPINMKLDLGGDINLSLLRIPEGRFVAGGGVTPVASCSSGESC